MTTWHLTIERASNGWIVRAPNDNDPDTDDTVTVITEYDYANGKVEAAVSLLYEVAEYFGLTGSKHDQKRLWIGTVERARPEDFTTWESSTITTDETRAEGEEGHPIVTNRTDVYGSEAQDTDEHLYERAED